ncbi:MopE-related protein [Paraliomyxa miuraensis]|uniref:MopE-related protein n=1 Tax=Paraliomyxa miuraensis TaxID=376150 RepID=UPI002251A0CC|nr:MopE-related protein [Paraliomyxa miuraensis]MCX4247231.1 MopE-related protein [Paraliomyxa miuraensis]
MRRFEVGLFGSVFIAASMVGCGGDDITGASGSATEGRTTGDTSAGVTGDTSADATGVGTGVGTMGGSGGGSGDTGVDNTAGNTSGPTTMGSNSAGSDGGSDTGEGGGPGPMPPVFPGVEIGLCAPPGEVRWCYTGAPATYNVGECTPGVQECVALDLDVGQWGECDGDLLPSMEICDGLDNDCNGDEDDGLGTTMCGIGPCLHEVPNCIDGQQQLCDPLDGALPEICDGQDNDCDGDIDEGLGDDTIYCGVGQCYHGVSACEGGLVPPCDPFAGASAETCDNIDNDCDGQVDEGLPDLTCGCGACDHTVPSCINGFPQVCDPFDGASPEICDGIDNDCDCIVDEDQGVWTCGTLECEVSVPQCIGGVPQPPGTCQPIPAGDEICGDGIDNNCDGIDAPCAETFLVGTDTQTRPIDVFWVVDSSGSMSAEMATVETNINNFASQLAASGSSTQLHLIADRGTGTFEICVTPPLGGAACGDNPGAGFWQYDTNGGIDGQEFVHSSNAIGRTMQQSGYWIPRLQPNSFMAFIFTSDDNGDDPQWGAADGDPSGVDDCPLGWIVDTTIDNYCRWDAPGPGLNYTSLAYDHVGYGGFATFMTNFFPGSAPGDDWAVFPIIGNTGTTVLNGANDVYEFNGCVNGVENGEEYVKLALLTDTQDSMFSICDAPWDLSSLANDILSGVPNDLYLLSGSPPGTCGMINPATITVVVNGIPLAPADWTYNPGTCVLQVVNNVPVVGDNVVIVYEMF